MKWYKRDPDAAISGMIGLSLEERGAYNTVIDLLYSRDGDLPTDDHFFSRALQCRPQVWRRVRDSLIAKGKLHYKTDGKLTANRVENELKTASKLIANMAELGRVSAEKRKQNKEHRPTETLVTTTTTTTSTSRKKEDGANAPDRRSELFGRGLEVLSQITGKPQRSLRPLLGKWLKDTGDDASRVLAAVDDAAADKVAEPIAWIEGRFRRDGRANETDKERNKRKYREALDKLQAFGEGRTDGDFGAPVVQLLPRSGSGG